jgi:hypothetical protein
MFPRHRAWSVPLMSVHPPVLILEIHETMAKDRLGDQIDNDDSVCGRPDSLARC